MAACDMLSSHKGVSNVMRDDLFVLSRKFREECMCITFVQCCIR